MAIPWLSALKAIPWGNVIEHAPNVLDKARDLIDKHRKTAEPETVDSKQNTASDLSPHDQLEIRLLDALKQIKLIQQKNDLLETKLVDIVNQQNISLKNIKNLRRANRWFLFFSFMLTLGNIGLWIFFSQKLN
jgi:hypothetical protein